jgi:iron complex transport system ATP-binding protein
MISVEGVSVSFGGLSVLDSVDLTVAEGEFAALVGPNGAGKTTLLRAITGYLDPDDGRVSLGGERVDELSSKAVSRRVATVPQDTHVGFSFTAEQLVEMGRTPHRSRLDWGEDSDAVADAMARTETLALRDRAVDDLSGGERQRVLLARALAQDPTALLLDEPTASLDINHQVQVLDLVRELADEGKAALAAIHDLDLAARFCDRLLLLRDGAICARGPPETVLSDPDLAAAFDTTTAVTRNPVTGTPTVTAVDRPDRDEQVHVVGGGAGGTAAVRALWRAGYTVSLGLVPAGDAAATLATALDLPTAVAPAFESPGPERRAEASSLAAAADAVVVTGGPGSDRHPTVETDVPHVRADLGGSGPRSARVDGGEAAVAESEAALLAAVADVIE